MVRWPLPFSPHCRPAGSRNRLKAATAPFQYALSTKGDHILPFVRCFYGSPSTYLWEDEMGVTQHVPQGEGREQGDPLMPILFALGQHGALKPRKRGWVVVTTSWLSLMTSTQ